MGVTFPLWISWDGSLWQPEELIVRPGSTVDSGGAQVDPFVAYSQIGSGAGTIWIDFARITGGVTFAGSMRWSYRQGRMTLHPEQEGLQETRPTFVKCVRWSTDPSLDDAVSVENECVKGVWRAKDSKLVVRCTSANEFWDLLPEVTALWSSLVLGELVP